MYWNKSMDLTKVANHTNDDDFDLNSGFIGMVSPNGTHRIYNVLQNG
jgi:hypothetical protein